MRRFRLEPTRPNPCLPELHWSGCHLSLPFIIRAAAAAGAEAEAAAAVAAAEAAAAEERALQREAETFELSQVGEAVVC